jgi:signal transduction histidine kinase
MGMSAHVKSHLYEPYFTTKQHGTGVGLASVYSTMRQLGGRVLVESELNRGTRVRLILPSWT